MSRISASKIKSHWEKHGTLKLAQKGIEYICRPFFLYMPLNFYCMCSLPQTQLQACCPLEIRKGTPSDMELMVKMPVDVDEASAQEQVEGYFNS